MDLWRYSSKSGLKKVSTCLTEQHDDEQIQKTSRSTFNLKSFGIKVGLDAAWRIVDEIAKIIQEGYFSLIFL